MKSLIIRCILPFAISSCTLIVIGTCLILTGIGLECFAGILLYICAIICIIILIFIIKDIIEDRIKHNKKNNKESKK